MRGACLPLAGSAPMVTLCSRELGGGATPVQHQEKRHPKVAFAASAEEVVSEFRRAHRALARVADMALRLDRQFGRVDAVPLVAALDREVVVDGDAFANL